MSRSDATPPFPLPPDSGRQPAPAPQPAAVPASNGNGTHHPNGHNATNAPFFGTAAPFGHTIAPFGGTQAPFGQPPGNLPPYPRAPGQEELTLSDLGPLTRQLLTQVRARWLAGLIAAVVTVAAAGWLFFRNPPEYIAETTLLAQSSLDKILNTSDSPAADSGQLHEENTLRNHLSVMTSRTFLTRVATSLKPDEVALVTTPYMNNGQAADPDFLPNLLSSKIDIERERGRDFFTIDIRHRSADVAVMLADHFTTQYLLYVQDQYRAASATAADILQKQADALSADIRHLEDERREYRKTYNLISVEENQSIISERLRRINAALSDVRVQRVGFETQLKQAQADLATSQTPYNNSVLAAFGNNQALRIELDRMRSQVEIYAKEYGPNHPKMVEARRTLAGLQQTLESNFRLAMADLQAKLDLATASEKQLNNELNTAFNQSLDIDKLAGSFNSLGDELVAKRKTQALLLQKISQTAVTGQISTDVMQIVDPPYLKRTSLKRQLLFAALVMMLAGGAFIGVPLLLHVFDERLSATTDLESLLGKELLGAVPRLTRTRAEDRPHLVRDNVDLPSVESFLSILGQLELLTKKPLPKRILVTSTLPGEGKSMVASNLAATFTRLGRRTLLVDCDFRRPTQSVIHQMPEGRGLLVWAANGFAQSGDLYATGGPLGLTRLPDGTFFLPAGAIDGQPTRHIITAGMSQLFDRLGELFDVVIVDTPPAGVFQDALILAKYCHETILVARDGRAQTPQVKRIIAEIDKTSSPVVGLVLNAFAPGATHPGLAYRHLADKYGYGYGYGKDGKKPAAKLAPQAAKA